MITYLKGDATQPFGKGPRYLVHICNDRGGWGAGFVLAVSKRWKDPESMYRGWFRSGFYGTDEDERPVEFELGNVQFVLVDHNGPLWVVNMLAQRGYGPKNQDQHRTAAGDAEIPLQYDALESCLLKIAPNVRLAKASVHMPRIGCGLAGGRWEKVEPIIQRALGDVPVYVYDP
jgi:hypothetical protein